MAKKMTVQGRRITKDFDELSDRGLLVEFADRFVAYEETGADLAAFELEHNYIEGEFEDRHGYNSRLVKKHEKLKMYHDEWFCLCREIVRHVKGDRDLLWC